MSEVELVKVSREWEGGDYYIEATDTSANSATSPAGAPGAFYSVNVILPSTTTTTTIPPVDDDTDDDLDDDLVDDDSTPIRDENKDEKFCCGC